MRLYNLCSRRAVSYLGIRKFDDASNTGGIASLGKFKVEGAHSSKRRRPLQC